MPERPDPFEPTRRRGATARFRQDRPGLRWVGVLMPIAGLGSGDIRVEEDELSLGRDAGCGAVIADDSVSPRHARIVRAGDEFVLEDLGSLHGTHVDGVPVLASVLHDGDTVQLGRNLYFFERVPEPAAARGESR
jgi:pSer/pThr/pTyr-binding forkhead associated (FHA) protein